MASALVLEALETLHKELDKMKPAVRQVEIAEQVIAEARKIPEQYIELMTRIEGQETAFKQKLADALNGHADQVRKEVHTLITEAGDTISNLSEQETQFDALRKHLEPLVSQLSNLDIEPRLDKLQVTTDKELEQLAGSNRLLETGLKGLEDRFSLTEVAIGNRLTEEGKTRRDQLESNANAIKLEVGRLNDRIKDTETILGEQIKTLHQNVIVHTEQVQRSMEEMTNQLLSRFDEVERQQKSQKVFTFITWVLIATAIAVSGFVK